MVDDIQIRTIGNLFRFLKADVMWNLLEVAEHTAIFARTSAPTLDPYGEGWWEQGVNRRNVFSHMPPKERIVASAKHALPERLKTFLREKYGLS